MIFLSLSGVVGSCGKIDVPSDLDAFQFYGATGDRVIIAAVTISGALDTLIELYPPNGDPQEASSVQCCWYGGDLLDHQLQQSGLYTIVIRDFGVSSVGDYKITLLKLPGAVSSPGDPDGGLIAPGQTLSGCINMPSDLDAFQFYGVAGDRVIITAVTIPDTGTLDTLIELYPPDGDPQEASSVQCCWYGGDLLDYQLQQSGLYTIVIRDFGVSNTGCYDISLTKIPNTPRPGLYDPSPSDKATLPVPSSCSLLSWDPVRGATGYNVYFGKDVIEPLEKIGNNLPSPSLPCPALETGKVYYWHVVAGGIKGPHWWFQVTGDSDITVTPTSLNFGSVPVGNESVSRTVTVRNDGAADLSIATITLGGTNPDQFRISDGCSGQTLPPTQSCTVSVSFQPTSACVKNATLVIPSNDPDENPVNVALSGIGSGITLLIPHGGETWFIGSTQTIQWTSCGVSGNVRIQLSRKGGAPGTWKTLFRNTANDGSQSWKVTKPATTQARVRVCSVSNPSICDTCYANFTIARR